MNICVLAGGQGSNLAALIDRFHRLSGHNVRIAAVASDSPDCGAAVLAEQYRIPLCVGDVGASRQGFLPGTVEQQFAEFMALQQIDFLVLAGFMRILRGRLLQEFRGRCINLHPSLLPAYPGLDTHRRVIRDGAHLHGCSVHWVTAKVDAGPLIAQSMLAVDSTDSAASLQRKVQDLEHRLLPDIVALIAAGKIKSPPVP